MLRKIFGAKRDELTGDWRKLHKAELHALYSSPDIIRNIKSRRLRWAGHIARMGIVRRIIVKTCVLFGSYFKHHYFCSFEERRLKWFGHVKRMKNGNISKRMLEYATEGRRRRGKPREQWMDEVRRSMSRGNLTKEYAENRDLWRRKIHLGEGQLLQCIK
ncbi:hypothetical protein ANN_14143 [Periplaneta americana]|uniref:Endonuclease-reverse transcriptase n=1 Tax=Periplaneta americana TaxID=6978 RepID=A0ABQ8SVH8_PERAM|nr:hypothetical protein ANN_14143 [Periplaneta americana]